MKQGYLSQYFEQVAAKRLSAVEVDTEISHQHELNGTRELKKVLGTGSGEKVEFPTTFIRLGDNYEALSTDGFVTWYDARLSHPKRSEYRLYFPTTDVSGMAKAGDMLFIAKRTDGSLMIIFTVSGSTVENQLLWLFGLPVQTGLTFSSKEIDNNEDKQINFAVRFILEELGIEIEETESEYLDTLIEQFDHVFPTTKEFSTFARKTLKEVNPLEEPDRALMSWMEHEEKLFRRLERKIVEERLKKGFLNGNDTDVDGFIHFSLSVQNRRKSRAGYALENHLEALFNKHSLLFSRTVETENKSKPDFLFPGGQSYHNLLFPSELLTMLGVKTSCKDRWRQILSEASRVEKKHLLTLEPGISENQTDEMRSHNVQLVLPLQLHETYRDKQRAWLMSIRDFIELTSERQRKSKL